MHGSETIRPALEIAFHVSTKVQHQFQRRHIVVIETVFRDAIVKEAMIVCSLRAEVIHLKIVARENLDE